mmetsp:Transcript_36435/g.74055  ORF Transcript_36435/g.74055 Transcript_36435/m.74055 type:complete len:153 (+) Transcript_36435:135-593(+)
MLFELIIFCSFQFHSIILLSVVDRNQSFCLNQASAHPMGNIFMGDERLFLESDCDEQLLMSIAFKATVNLEAISFVGPIGEKAPLTVKLYANASNMGFDNCESLAPTQEFQLTPADLAPDAMTTVYKVKFQRIDSLTVIRHTFRYFYLSYIP